MTGTRIRILIVEDNVFTRLGITSLLATQADMEVVGTAEDGAQAVSLHRTLKPDVIICDLRMPHFDGFQTITAIRGEAPAPRILVLTNFEGDENIHRALEAGALGYMTKDIQGAPFFEAVRQVAAGNRYLPPTIARQLAERTAESTLTARELQVLGLVSKGLSNRQIAKTLELSQKTAEAYVSKILGKLGAQSRTEAVAIAMQRGLIAQPI